MNTLEKNRKLLLNSLSIAASQSTINLATSTHLLAHNSVGQKFRHIVMGPQLRGLQGCNQDVGWAAFLCGGFGGEFVSQLLQVMG